MYLCNALSLPLPFFVFVFVWFLYLVSGSRFLGLRMVLKGVIVAHAIFGISDNERLYALELAHRGYVAIVFLSLSFCLRPLTFDLCLHL